MSASSQVSFRLVFGAAARLNSAAAASPPCLAVLTYSRPCWPLYRGAPRLAVALFPATDAHADELETAPAVEHELVFGSYGRVVGAANLRGGAGTQLNAVSYGPRLEESLYRELRDFQYRFQVDDGARFRVVDPGDHRDALFHLDGDFTGAIALRNAHASTRRTLGWTG